MADSLAQTVKQQADIVRIVGEYVKLRKSGANFSALCPFHKEKSGSFYLYPANASYYCFGCHEHGDVFSFVMKMESLSFPEAVRAVAAKCGIALPKREFASAEDAREAGLRRQLIDCHEAAVQYFEQMLHAPEAARAREYLTSRAVSPETIKAFRIGYAPESFNDMRERLGKFFPEEVLRASGLFSSKEKDDGSAGPLYARFRKRITFPIANEQGKVIAFTARALDTNDDKAGPKYLNSPETPLYTKGQVLFNLDKAKQAIRETDIALLVEGQMDCIRVFTSGIRNVIATSGTAFTEHQVRLLARFTKRVVLNFDPDQAGANAAEKTIAQLVEEGFEVRVVTLDGGMDPDRFIQERGVAEYSQTVRNAVRYADYLIERARIAFPPRTAENKIKAMNMLLPHIRRVPNAIARSEFAENVAQKLGIDNALLRQELKHAAQQRLESVKAAQPRVVTEVERILLSALVMPDGSAPRETAVAQLAAQPEWFSALATAPTMEILVHAPPPSSPFDAAPDTAQRALLASALQSAAEGDSVTEHNVHNALATLEDQYLERRSREVRQQLSEAERRGDAEMQMQLLRESVRLGQQIAQARKARRG